MNIQNQAKTSFQGGFRFPKMPAKAKFQLPEIHKRGKQIFYDFENQGDVFLVVRNKLDQKVAKFIAENKLKFEYYPEINTKCHLDDEKPELLVELLEKGIKPATTKLSELKKLVKIPIIKPAAKENSETYVPQILKALCIDNKHPVTKFKGANVVADNEFKRKICITKATKTDVHYVVVVPQSKNEPIQRYAISTDGVILSTYNTPEKMKAFQKKFNALLEK